MPSAGAGSALPQRRRYMVKSLIDEQGQATVTDLAETLGVSVDTIRRDLEWLADRNEVLRTHGGAVTKSDLASADPDFEKRAATYAAAKAAIGQAVADRISDGQTLLINGGTTTLATVRALRGRRNLTIITNNLQIPGAAPTEAVRDILLLGGVVRPSSHVTIGQVSFPDTAGISADVAILGVGGVSRGAGLSTSGLAEAQMMSQMIERSRRTIVVADSSKFDRNALAHIARLDAVSLLVTDAPPQGELAEALSAADVEVVLATVKPDRERTRVDGVPE